MPYTLTRRQELAFSDLFDVYRPVKRTSATKKFQGLKWELAASGVSGRIQPKPESAAPGPIGRSNVDQIDTTDILRMHFDEECDDGYRIQMKTPGHPEYGTWYMVRGGPLVNLWRAGQKWFYIARSLEADTEA